jgi:Holliday junction resolvase RusA-like endonuclease
MSTNKEVKEISVILPGKPRPNQSLRYYRGKIYNPQTHFMNKLKMICITQLPRGYKPFPKNIAITLSLTFFFKIPKSRKNKDDERLPYHINVPDVDNLEKLYIDVIKNILITDDKQINVILAQKMYHHTKSFTEIHCKPTAGVPLTLER